MRIVVLHGQNHKGSTYRITQMFLNEIKTEDTQISEFYFVSNKACVGCMQCIKKGEGNCPHYEENKLTIGAIEQADLVIIESPCYCMGISGQLKIFLDHMAYRWMAHRPHKNMFHKVGLVVSTAAGAGASKVTKDLCQQLFYWGIPIIHRFPINIWATSFDTISQKRMKKINKKVKKISTKIKKQVENVKPSFKTKFIFEIMRKNQVSNEWNITDKKHWENENWLESARPWKE